MLDDDNNKTVYPINASTVQDLKNPLELGKTITVSMNSALELRLTDSTQKDLNRQPQRPK